MYRTSITLPGLSHKSCYTMGLAFNFLLTILIELPIIALFFKRKKRQHALLMALLINIISWSVSHVIFFSVDVNMLYVAIALAAGEAIAFHKLLDCKWIKAILMSLIVNSLSFFITHLIPGDLDIFPSKPQPVRTELIIESPFMRNPPKKC